MSPGDIKRMREPNDTLWWLLSPKVSICPDIGETTELKTEGKVSQALKK